MKTIGKRRVHKIHIIPAIFIEKRGNKYLVKCLLGLGGNTIEERLFENNMLEGMTNPKYLLIGITTGENWIQTTFAQADEFEDVFKNKWKALIQ
jgi:hypothetical protein